MTIPNLAGVITKEDIFKKGHADFVAWARIANYLHAQAPGWEFVVKENPEKTGHIWTAPDGTGYIVTYFTGPDDEATPDFLYACQDNRNSPIKVEKISCRTLTDTHRRALCANAAFTFSLGYELWARLEVSNDSQAETTPSIKSSVSTTPAQPQHDITVSNPPLDPDERSLLMTQLMELHTANSKAFSSLDKAYRSHFSDCKDKMSDHIQEEKHASFLADWFVSNAAALKP